jgi:5'-methylthioadenosine phosphorylase
MEARAMSDNASVGLIVRDFNQVSDFFKNGQDTYLETEYGRVTVKSRGRWLVLCRSGCEGDAYLMPHEYNIPAHLAALRQMGVSDVVGLHSTGSLRPSLAPGMLLIPDDWISLAPQPTTIRGSRRHLTPGFSSRVRQNLVTAAWKIKARFENGGIYWQTHGPRLETRAEIKLMSAFADVVGMGMVTEAILAQEMGLEYGALCSVDNYANGLGSPKLTDEMIVEQCLKNAGLISSLLDAYSS